MLKKIVNLVKNYEFQSIGFGTLYTKFSNDRTIFQCFD